MSEELVELEPQRCAQLIAPVLDRLRLALAERVKVHAPRVAATHGLTMPSVMTAGYLRNVYPDRSFNPRGLLAVFIYQSLDQVTGGLNALLASNHLERVDDELLKLSASGREVLRDMVTASDQTAQELWAPDGAVIDRVLLLAERAVAAIDDGGDTVALMAPSAGNAAGLSSRGRFAELLTALRFHRFDSHIAAWRTAGLTLEQIKQLPGGTERDAIEADTDRRASTPYRALSPQQRLDLLAGMAALHG